LIAATYGMPPKRYGFQSGKPWPARSDAAANSRNAYPPMYWSLVGLTRKRPTSAGYARMSVATMYTSAAHAVANRGSPNAGARVAARLSRAFDWAIGASWAHPTVCQKENRGDDLENREPHARRDDEQRRLAAGETSLPQPGEHDNLSYADPTRRDERQKSGQIRGRENCDVGANRASRPAQHANRHHSERHPIYNPRRRGDEGGDPDRHVRNTSGQVAQPRNELGREQESETEQRDHGDAQRRHVQDAGAREREHYESGNGIDEGHDDRGTRRGNARHTALLRHHGHRSHLPHLARDVPAKVRHAPDSRALPEPERGCGRTAPLPFPAREHDPPSFDEQRVVREHDDAREREHAPSRTRLVHGRGDGLPLSHERIRHGHDDGDRERNLRQEQQPLISRRAQEWSDRAWRSAAQRTPARTTPARARVRRRRAPARDPDSAALRRSTARALSGRAAAPAHPSDRCARCRSDRR